jgi:hypothetical protein
VARGRRPYAALTSRPRQSPAIKPTAAGKKVLRRKGRLRVKVRLTFTPTGGAPRSQIKSVTLKVKKKPHRH